MTTGWRLAAVGLLLAACDGPPAGNDGGGGADAPVADGAASDAGGDAAWPDAPAGPLRRLAYLADQTIDQVPELFLARVQGTTVLAPERLHSPLDLDMSVRGFTWAPDGSAVAMQADLYDGDDMSNAMDIYVIDVGGAPPYAAVKVNGDFPWYGDAGPVRSTGVPKWSPDSVRIAYLSDEQEYGVYELYIYQVTGPNAGSRWKVNGQLKIDFDVSGFVWSPDGSRIAYRAVQNDTWELFVASVGDGGPGTAVVVNTPLAAGRVEEDGFRDLGMWGEGFQFAPDSQSIAYLARVNDKEELYWVDLSGAIPATAQKISAPLASGWVDSAFWAPDGGWLAYHTYNPHDLYVVDLKPSPAAAVKVNGLEYAAGSTVSDFPLWSPDSTKLAYHAATAAGGGPVELWVVSLSATSPSFPRRANGTLPSSGDVIVSPANYRTLTWSPDSALLVYAAEQIDPFEPELFVVDTSTTASWTSQRVDDQRTSLQNHFYFASGARRLLYRASEDGVTQLFVADLTGAAPYATARVNGDLTLGGAVDFPSTATLPPWSWNPGGSAIGYLADEQTNERIELFVADLADLGTSTAVSGTLISASDVLDFAWSP